MTPNTEPLAAPSRAQKLRRPLTIVIRQAARAVDRGRVMSGGGIASSISEAAHTTQAGAQATTLALQTLPDSTLTGFAATSIGLGAGVYLAGGPRLASAAAVVPAVVMGVAIALRPASSATRLPSHP